MRRVGFCRKSFLNKEGIKNLLKNGLQISSSNLLTVNMKIQTDNQLEITDRTVLNKSIKIQKDNSANKKSNNKKLRNDCSKKSFKNEDNYDTTSIDGVFFRIRSSRRGSRHVKNNQMDLDNQPLSDMESDISRDVYNLSSESGSEFNIFGKLIEGKGNFMNKINNRKFFLICRKLSEKNLLNI